MDAIKFSIVIPVFNADNSLERLHKSIVDFFESKNTSFQIVYVDDASTDNSWDVLKKIKERSSAPTTIVRLSKNFGQHGATLCGFKYSSGTFVITMDDDLEVHPNEIAKLIDAQTRTNFDLVYGVYPKQNSSPIRKFLTITFKALSKIEGSNNGKGSSFRIIKQELAQKLVANHKQFVFIDELCLWYTQKITSVPVAFNKDFVLKNRYSIGGLLMLSSNIIMFSSTFPLKIVTNLGFLLFFTNFIIGLSFIVKKFVLGTPVEGFTSLIVSILFSTGLIIFCIGIIAQYLSKVLKAVNNAPSYNEEEIIC